LFTIFAVIAASHLTPIPLCKMTVSTSPILKG
jgi:hypothetical protein